jgi:hypothetical protein
MPHFLLYLKFLVLNLKGLFFRLDTFLVLISEFCFFKKFRSGFIFFQMIYCNSNTYKEIEVVLLG